MALAKNLSSSELPPTPGIGQHKHFGDRRSVKAQTFERKSVKFWVPLHRVTAVIEIVKKYVPISRRGVVHSIYFDNDESTMYSARLIRQGGSQLLRFRWYGDDQPQESGGVFIETKTHNNDRPSLKERFKLSPTSAYSFESGVDDMEVGKLGEKAGALAKKAREIMVKHKLHRVLRTEYYRTAFESSTQSDFRASLDQNVCFVKEESKESQGAGMSTSGPAWIFPHAVFELKISSEALERSKDVVQRFTDELVSVGGAVVAPKFSKFLSGYAAHYNDKAGVVPSWMSHEKIVAAVQGREAGGGGVQGGYESGMARRQAGQAGQATYDRVNDFKAERKAEKEAKKKDRGVDQKSIMANERTLLAWMRTTMLLLYGSSYFLDHDLDGGANKVLGWTGIVSSLGVVLWAQWRYNKRNNMLLRSEMDIAKYSDKYGTNFLVLCTIVCSVAGLIAYQKSVLTYNNWAYTYTERHGEGI
ncbi:hypothetical protein TrRE_jg5280 [Triparma retinervis]|uniref:VTC domain-containing protein n=1 Tax=Triparma retinervis TaxID=2557542 RepID=A0A9W7A0W3_9STRA|nr:hypothetical protein TrRE_jg5280 [Triparma retinervis]